MRNERECQLRKSKNGYLLSSPTTETKRKQNDIYQDKRESPSRSRTQPHSKMMLLRATYPSQT